MAIYLCLAWCHSMLAWAQALHYTPAQINVSPCIIMNPYRLVYIG